MLCPPRLCCTEGPWPVESPYDEPEEGEEESPYDEPEEGEDPDVLDEVPDEPEVSVDVDDVGVLWRRTPDMIPVTVRLPTPSIAVSPATTALPRARVLMGTPPVRVRYLP